MIKYIDEELIREACNDDEVVDKAVRIAAKFCEKHFSVINSSINTKEVSTFCATTLFLNKECTINGRDGERSFCVESDYYNALAAACQCGDNPISLVNNIRKPAKSYGKHISYDSSSDIIEDYSDATDPFFESVLDEAERLLSERERMIIFECDGNVTVYAVMEVYGVTRGQAESICKQIEKKLRYIKSIFEN